MAISKKQFLDGSFNRRENKIITIKEKILSFLAAHANLAYKAEEIAKALKANKWTTQQSLARHIKARKVLHKKPYFMYNSNNKK